MNLKQLKQDMKIIVGLTWFNFNSGKPDLIDITNGCTDKYIPSTTALKVETLGTDKSYLWEAAEQEKVLRERLSAIGFPNSYAMGSSVIDIIDVHYNHPSARMSTMVRESMRSIETKTNYSSGYAPRAECSIDSVGSMDSLELDVFRSLREPGISEFKPRISKTRTEGGYVGIRYTFGDPKKPSGAA